MSADDWSASEDALLVAALRRGDDWDSIADSLLRPTREVKEHAARLQRAANARATPAPPATPTPAPVAAPAPAPAATTVVIRGICEICDQPIYGHGPRRRYCGPEHMMEGNRRREAERLRQQERAQAEADQARAIAAAEAAAPPPQPAPTLEAPIKAKPPKQRPTLRAGTCRATHAAHPCVLRGRHPGEHLTDNGIIFSRDGKDVWRDIGDVYLMMALNNDLVAPQP